MNNNINFSDFIQQTVIPFADQFPIQFVLGKKDCQIAYRHFVHPEGCNKLMVLVNGRGENLLKWSEVAFDFYQQGYDVLIMDHRGQGNSNRLLKNLKKGHLDEFRFYVSDLDLVIRTVTQSYHYEKQFLLGHSTGALISAYYLANCDHDIKRAIFSSPFFGVLAPHPLGDQFLVDLMMIFGQGSRYVFGKGDYQPINIEDTVLSNSKVRMQWMNDIYQKDPSLAIGGPTFRWLHLCWKAIYDLKKILPRIEIPVLILQAENDQVVNNNLLDQYVTLLPKGQKVLIKGAKHEILFEQDPVRENALMQDFNFLNN